jgi:putative thioredoxin
MERMRCGKIQTEIEVNDENFQEKVIEQSKKVPVVVDFWASWCTPCLMLSPILEKLAKEYNGKFILAKANVDETRTYAQEYMVMSIPNVKLFKNGKVVDEFVGALPESSVRKWLDKNIKSG